MNYYRMKVVVLVLGLLIVHFSIAQGQASWSGELEPVGGPEYRVMEMDNRRRLSPFQLCLLCKCCAASSSSSSSNATCVTVPCCFGIDCQLPNKPYGVCAFVPKTCNCTACAHH